jgi:hypothetical protein
MVEGVRLHTNVGGRRVPNVEVPVCQLFAIDTHLIFLTGIAGNPFPVYFFMIAPSGPFDVP